MGNCGSTTDKTTKKVTEEVKKEGEKFENKTEKEVRDKVKSEEQKLENKVEEKANDLKEEVKDEGNKLKDDAHTGVNEVTSHLEHEEVDGANFHEKVLRQTVKSLNDFTGKIKKDKFDNFKNIAIKELNYSAKRVTKYFLNQMAKDVADFHDDLFPADRTSLFGLDKDGNPIDQDKNRRAEAEADFRINENDIVWLRPKEFMGEYALFEGDIEFDDIRQGSIGNCYFMASISALTETPNIIAEIFRSHEVNPNGYYELCLKLDGEWQVVIVDDYIPCSKTTRKPIFANPKGHEIWALLLEKAWAKVNRGYINTVAGNASEVIECMTNFPYNWNVVENTDSEELWAKIVKASGNKYVMTTSIPQRKGAKERGLVEGHQYSLTSGKEYNGIRLLKIRNPWGSMKYTGEWHQNDEKWTDDLKAAFDYKSTYDGEGEFFISWEDFKYFFVDVDICEIDDNICMKRVQVQSREWKNGPQCYQLVIFEKAKVTITIYKPYYRFVKALPTDWTVTQQIFMAKCDDHDTQSYSEYFGSTDGQNDCTITRDLEAGTYYFYVYVNYASAKDLDGNPLSKEIVDSLQNNINVYSSELFGLNKVEEPLMGTFYRIAQDFCKKTELKNQNNLLTYSAQNFFKSEFYFIYIKSLVTKPIDFKLTLSNVELLNVTHKDNPITFILAPQQEQIVFFSCNDMFEGHGMAFSYTYKGTKQTTTDDLIPTFRTSYADNLRSKNLRHYNWVYKYGQVDYRNILKKIDANDAAFRFYVKQYPKDCEDVQNVPKLENHETLELEVKDKMDFGDGDWYFGEWKEHEGSLQMWGRGKGQFGGNTFVGQFQNHQFTGVGKLILPNNDVISGNFVNFNPKGKCTYTKNDGKVVQKTYK